MKLTPEGFWCMVVPSLWNIENLLFSGFKNRLGSLEIFLGEDMKASKMHQNLVLLRLRLKCKFFRGEKFIINRRCNSTLLIQVSQSSGNP